MTKQSIAKFLSVGLCMGTLMFTGCGKDSQDTGTGNADNADTAENDTDTDGGDVVDTEAPGDGDGDGDPATSVGFVPMDDDMLGAAACDPWVQDCPEGEKCAAVNQGGDTWGFNKSIQRLTSTT